MGLGAGINWHGASGNGVRRQRQIRLKTEHRSTEEPVYRTTVFPPPQKPASPCLRENQSFSRNNAIEPQPQRSGDSPRQITPISQRRLGDTDPRQMGYRGNIVEAKTKTRSPKGEVFRSIFLLLLSLLSVPSVLSVVKLFCIAPA